MNSYLKQSTASQSRAIGPFIDDTDFKTPATGLTIANTDIKLVINGAASANKNSGGGTHRVNGVYGVTFDATDTATVGEIEVSIVVAGALPVFHTFVVLEEEVYDDLFASSAVGYLKPTTAGRDLDVSAGGEAGVDWANVGSPTTTLNLSGTSTLALEPTTAGRKLDVTAGGNAGIDWANVEAPTTTLNLSGTTVKTATDIATQVAALENLSSAQVAALLTATIADSLPADGVRPSIASGILFLTRFLMEKSVAGTTVTVKKEDGSTSVATFTLDDASNPTSITRAT